MFNVHILKSFVDWYFDPLLLCTLILSKIMIDEVLCFGLESGYAGGTLLWCSCCWTSPHQKENCPCLMIPSWLSQQITYYQTQWGKWTSQTFWHIQVMKLMNKHTDSILEWKGLKLQPQVLETGYSILGSPWMWSPACLCLLTGHNLNWFGRLLNSWCSVIGVFTLLPILWLRVKVCNVFNV